MPAVIKEKENIRLFQDYAPPGVGGYVYWVDGNEEEKTASYREAQGMFQSAVAAALEHGEGDCPKCGGHLRTVGCGKGLTHRWVQECPRCGYVEDEMDTDHARQILEQAGVLRRDTPNHREGRVGVKEVLQGNVEGHDPQFD